MAISLRASSTLRSPSAKASNIRARIFWVSSDSIYFLFKNLILIFFEEVEFYLIINKF